ncbi:unnamed protein product, partial [Symbiodinium microadriaticum]
WRSCQQSLLLHAGRLHLRQEEREEREDGHDHTRSNGQEHRYHVVHYAQQVLGGIPLRSAVTGRRCRRDSPGTARRACGREHLRRLRRGLPGRAE